MESVNPYIYVGLREPYRLLYRRHIHADAKDVAMMDLKTICNATGIIPGELLSASRKREFVWPRFVLMAHMRRELNMTLKEIADFFNRDHTTVIYAINQYDDLYMYDKEFRTFAKQINLPKYGKKTLDARKL